MDIDYSERNSMRDLFALDQRFEDVPMRDADVSILRGLQTHAPYYLILKRLIDQTIWRQEKVNIFGKKLDQPRLISWYGDPGRRYSYSGIRNDPFPWTDLLRELKRNVESCSDAQFNSVLLNFYRNERDSMGFHSDDEKELGPEPSIASLSFGSTRTFIFKHKIDKDAKRVTVPLEEGSVLLMRGSTQKCWKHAIDKEKRPLGPRVNLTFRYIYSQSELDAFCN